MPATPPNGARTILLIGASRGLGLAMAGEFLNKGWNVVGTVYSAGRTGLHELADDNPGRIEIESLDVIDEGQIAALRHRLAGRKFKILFHNAGVADDKPLEAVGKIATDEFVRLMVTNALGPMRVIEGLQDLVTGDGLIGVMSSDKAASPTTKKAARKLIAAARPL